MAINPPSDIVLGVARAADPVARQAALQKLAGAAASPAVDSGLFASHMDRLQPMGSCSPRSLPAGGDKSAEAYKSFEAFFIQSFIQSMLPKGMDATYGSGTAGEMWRSMSAEHMANAIADAGGVGIAERLMPSATTSVPAFDEADEPFSLSSASGARPFQDWASYLPFLAQGSSFWQSRSSIAEDGSHVDGV